MAGKTKTLLGIILLALFCGNVIYLANKKTSGVRLDFTSEGLYTLSPATKEILKKIQTPLKAKLYYAKTASLKGPESLRFYNNYFNYIRELLSEYQSIAGKNRFKLEVIDPRPDTDEEADALKYGLKRYQITETESFFFGLVIINESGNEEVVPFFTPDRQEFIEYDLSRMVVLVNQEKKRKLGILSSLPVLGDDVTGFMAQMMRMQGKQVRPAWTTFQILQQVYEITTLDPGIEAIENIDLLLIVHPKNISPKTQYAIDQYLLKGGKIILMVDNYCMADEPPMTQNPLQGMLAERKSSLNELLKGWGLEQIEGKFPGSQALSKRVQTQPFNPPAPFLGLLELKPEFLDQEEVVTSQIKEMEWFFPAGFKKVELTATDSPKIEMQPLILTDSKAGFYTVEPFEFQNPVPEKLQEKFIPGSEKIILAARLSGTFASAFPEGPPQEASKPDQDPKVLKKALEEKKKNHLTRGKKESSVMVFGDVDFITDTFAFQRSFFGAAAKNENHNLLLNAIEFLMGSNELIKIRARGQFKRPFTLFEKMQSEADKNSASEVQKLNASITTFQEEIRGLQSKANKDNIALLQAEALQKQKELQVKMADSQKQLREVKRKRRQGIEEKETFLKNLNLFLIPFLILFAWVFTWLVGTRRKTYVKLSAAGSGR